jgi:hypothetical protein
MIATSEPRIRLRATAIELEHRLTCVAATLFDGVPASGVIRHAMRTFGVSRRMAQRYVQRITRMEDPLVQRVRAAAKELLARQRTGLAAGPEGDPACCAGL